MVDEYLFCYNYKRTVPHPQKKFELTVVASNDTGGIKVVPEDQQVCMLIGKRARQLVDTKGSAKEFLQILKELDNKDYTLKLRIKEFNILDKIEVYWATNICNGFKLEELDTIEDKEEVPQTATQATTSTYHLEVMLDLNCQSS
ncbi:hypothetical protein POM88_022522 [Heracleum sosnowskyi]|uniref:Uncharacterized protein n=1 Tax=Heracleum sosnowskyi TaxID=360622 RepID=A0AAD8IF59_9APIA|nr:hypothetical protein POM88_022522 [Heracleum sosnowskyi]